MLMSIDPGANGGIALFFDDGTLVEAKRLKKTKGERFFTPEDLQPVRDMASVASLVVLEEVFWHKPPKQSMNHHGTTIACWGQLLASIQCPVETVIAKDWKKRMGLVKATKLQSIEMARELFPDLADNVLKTNAACDGVAEALLIGVDFLRRTK